MADRQGSLIEENFALLKMIQASHYSIYKKPTNFYEQIINAMAVQLQVKRSGDFRSCPLETRYQELKSLNFPQEVVKDIIEEAAKKCQKENRQKKISSFFQQKLPETANLEPEVIIEDTAEELCADIFDDGSSVVEKDIVSEERFSNDPKHLKELCNLLGVKKVSYLGSSIAEEDNISILAKEMLPKFKTYQELSHQVDGNAKYFQSNSKFSSLRDEVTSKIQKTKDDLEDLVENAVLMTDGVKNISIPEKRKLLDYCLRKLSVCVENLSKTMDNLNHLLAEMNRKLQKRKSNLKMALQTGFKITSKN